MKKNQLVTISLSVIVILALAFAIGKYAGFLDITAGDHHIVADGQNWTLSAPWGSQTGVNCARYATITNDTSTSDQVQVTGKLFNSGSQSCGSGTGSSVKVTLDSIDLSKYQRVVIHRAVTYSAASTSYNGATGLTSKVNDLTYSKTSGASTSISGNLGDVFISNDGSVLTIQSDEGSKVYDGKATRYFTNTIGVTAQDHSLGGGFTYTITSLELTPFPTASVTTPLFTAPSTQQLTAATTTVSSWWDRFVIWLKGFF